MPAERFEPIEPRFIISSLASRFVFAVVLTALGAAVAAFTSFDTVAYSITGLLVLWVVVAAALYVVAYKRIGYLLRAQDLTVRTGWLSTSVNSMPFTRVESVEVTSGLFDRMLGLARVQMRGAGGSIDIPGLGRDRADQIQRYVLARLEELGPKPEKTTETGRDGGEPTGGHEGAGS